MPRLSLGLGVQNVRKIKSGGAAPSGLAYADASSVAISAINFTLLKTNTNGDGNLTYGFDEGVNTPTNYYGLSDYNFETGVGNRAILAFNASASTYYSNQPSNVANVSLTTNKWYLIVFSAGNYDSDSGGYPPVPSTVYVNNSTGQSGSYIPTSGWSPTLTIQAGMYASTGVDVHILVGFGGSSADLVKQSNTLWSGSNDGDPALPVSLQWASTKWTLTMLDEFASPLYVAESTSGTISVIPLLGWSYTLGSGGAITLSPYIY
jgi:hypothetical protein